MAKFLDIPVAQAQMTSQSSVVAPDVGSAGIIGRARQAQGVGYEQQGQGMQNVARGLLQTGGIVDAGIAQRARLEEESQKREAAAYVSEQRAQFHLNQVQRFEQMKTSGGNINKFTDNFLDAFEKDVDQVIENAPNDFAKQAFRDVSFNIKESLGSRAIGWQADQKVAQQKESASNAINAHINAVFMDPESFGEVSAQMQDDFAVASKFMTPGELQDFKAGGLGKLAEARIRAEIDRNPAAAKQMLQDESFLSVLPTERVYSLSDKIDAEQQKIQNEAIKIQQKAMRLFTDDPAQLAILNGANPEDLDDIIEQQYIATGDGRQIKVSPDNVSVLPKQQAGMLATTLNGLNNPDIMAKALQGLEDKYGEHYPIAMRDMKKAGLSPDVAFISFMDSATDKHVVDAAFALRGDGAKQTIDLARARASSQNESFAKLENGVFAGLEDLANAMTLEGVPPEQINDLRNRSVNVAAYFYQQGGNMDDAAKKATEWLSNKYGFVEINDKKIRIPRDYDPDTIEEGLDITLENLMPDQIDITSAAGGAEFAFENIKDRGYFVINSAEDGFILMDEFGVPVRSKGGVAPFELPVSKIVDMQVEAAVKRQEAIRDHRERRRERQGRRSLFKRQIEEQQ